ncbi:MAG: hypothetical protein ACRD3I_04655, partial [Terriglobales bacterium]
DLTEQMFPQAASDVTGSTRVTYQGEEIEFAKWQRLSMREAIIRYWPEAAGARPEMSDFASGDSAGRLVKRFNAAHAHMPYDPDAPAGKTIADLFGAVAEPHRFSPPSFTTSRWPSRRFPRTSATNPTGWSASRCSSDGWSWATPSAN